ncbi:alpha/beta hydrolase, partial [Vibrio parahaemolyticus]|nr:alpha/beta hydrolase [Vibrio parahaemolyticus]
MHVAPITSLQTWFPEHLVLPLWSEPQIPSHLVQSYQERNPNELLPDRAVFDITHPEIVVFEPEQSNGIGILLMPGGGYQRVSVDKEGADSARVLNQAGFTVFVMTYRMPNEGHEFGAWTPLADAQRAMRLVRQLPLASHLSWIGVLGFSAGGHVAASLATSHALDIYPLQDEADRVSAKPDFCALMYPVISMNTDIAHMGSRAELLANLERESDLLRFSLEKQVTSDMPP